MADIEVTQVLLGLRPYVLIEFKKGPDGEGDLRADHDFGGGMTEVEDAGAAMAIVLAGLTRTQNPLDEDLSALEAERPDLAEVVALLRERWGWGA